MEPQREHTVGNAPRTRPWIVVMSLRGRSVLIVDSENSIFVLQLELAIEQAAGECLVVRYVDSALRRTEQFNFKAALVHVEDRAIVDQLRIPHLLYTRSESPKSIVAALQEMLAGSA